MTTQAFLRTARRLRGEYGPVLSDTYLTPVAAICMTSSPKVGLGLWLVLIQQPALALAAFVALSFFQALAIWRGHVLRDRVFDISLRANGLLSALAGTWVFLPSERPIVLIVVMIAAVVLGGMVFTFLAKDLVAKSRLPALVWPYCLIAVIVLTIFPQAAAVSLDYFSWPILQVDEPRDLATVFLQSLGIFLFSPMSVSGLLIAGVLLAWSPAMVLAGVVGWVAGVSVSALLVAAGAPIFWEAASYNFFLSGAALGAVFFAPGARGLVFAAIGGSFAAVIAAMLQVLLVYSAVSYLPIPFALTLYAGLLLFSSPPFGRAQDIVETWTARPEENRLSRIWLRARWGPRGTPLLAVPMQGVLEVTQGFDGALSHRGDWRHALDFQRPVPPGGDAASRPSIWGEPAFSPVSGKVLAINAAVPDNAPGQVNYADNWGNNVVIEARSGARVLMAHLMQHSILVGAGQQVGFSSQIGFVGNSGRSAVPHLHLHAQSGDQPGDPTRDFRLANYFLCAPDTQLATEWRASGHVAQGDLVTAAPPNPEIRAILSGMLPGRSIWAASGTGPLVIETSVLEDGGYAIRDTASGSMNVALELDGLRVTALNAPADSFISLLSICLATIPYAAFAGLSWSDCLPRQFGSMTERYLAQLDPRWQATMNCLTLRCDAVVTDDGPGIVITANPKARARHLPLYCTLSIVPQQGPVRLVARFGDSTLSFRQISFEPHER